MHLGIHIVQTPSASPPAVLQAAAHAAETLGYRSLWVGDRLMEGVGGRTGDGRPLDALATLAFLAAATDRIRLGTNVLAGAWYPPARPDDTAETSAGPSRSCAWPTQRSS